MFGNFCARLSGPESGQAGGTATRSDTQPTAKAPGRGRHGLLATTGQGLPAAGLLARRVGNSFRRQDKGEPCLSIVAEKTQPGKGSRQGACPMDE